MRRSILLPSTSLLSPCFHFNNSLCPPGGGSKYRKQSSFLFLLSLIFTWRGRQGKKDAARMRSERTGNEEAVGRKYAELFTGSKDMLEKVGEVAAKDVSYISPGGRVVGVEAVVSLWQVWFDAMGEGAFKLISVRKTEPMHVAVVFKGTDCEVTDELALGASTKIVTIRRTVDGDADGSKGVLVQRLESQVRSLEETLLRSNEASESRLNALVKLARAGTAVVRTVSSDVTGTERDQETEERLKAVEKELGALRDGQRQKEILWRELLRKKDAQLTLTLTREKAHIEKLRDQISTLNAQLAGMRDGPSAEINKANSEHRSNMQAIMKRLLADPRVARLQADQRKLLDEFAFEVSVAVEVHTTVTQRVAEAKPRSARRSQPRRPTPPAASTPSRATPKQKPLLTIEDDPSVSAIERALGVGSGEGKVEIGTQTDPPQAKPVAQPPSSPVPTPEEPLGEALPLPARRGQGRRERPGAKGEEGAQGPADAPSPASPVAPAVKGAVAKRDQGVQVQVQGMQDGAQNRDRSDTAMRTLPRRAVPGGGGGPAQDELQLLRRRLADALTRKAVALAQIEAAESVSQLVSTSPRKPVALGPVARVSQRNPAPARGPSQRRGQDGQGTEQKTASRGDPLRKGSGGGASAVPSREVSPRARSSKPPPRSGPTQGQAEAEGDRRASGQCASDTAPTRTHLEPDPPREGPEASESAMVLPPPDEGDPEVPALPSEGVGETGASQAELPPEVAPQLAEAAAPGHPGSALEWRPVARRAAAASESVDLDDSDASVLDALREAVGQAEGEADELEGRCFDFVDAMLLGNAVKPPPPVLFKV
eukprot:Hpha_TRINITY_DN15609_c3_g4::TRINITY_DN15609_c3_g4_i2::g.98749::m.98749